MPENDGARDPTGSKLNDIQLIIYNSWLSVMMSGKIFKKLWFIGDGLLLRDILLISNWDNSVYDFKNIEKDLVLPIKYAFNTFDVL